MRIELEIEELVLRGFEARDRYRIADAVARALPTYVTRADVMRLMRAGPSQPVLRGATYAPAGGGTARALGEGIAGSLAAAISGDRE
jgi:hypothetical protein